MTFLSFFESTIPQTNFVLVNPSNPVAKLADHQVLL